MDYSCSRGVVVEGVARYCVVADQLFEFLTYVGTGCGSG